MPKQSFLIGTEGPPQTADALRRLQFIEFRLFWEGGLNRADLAESFHISAAQASADLQRYAGLAPGNISYDTSTKRFVASDVFQARLIDTSPAALLARLAAVAEGYLEPRHAWLSAAPPIGFAPLPARVIDASILRELLHAIRHQLAIEVLYQSFSQPEPMWRWITPHAIAFDGVRWHVRAFSSVRFSDFVLSRFLQIRLTRSDPQRGTQDIAWHANVNLLFVPHQAASEGQRRAIELEYGMTNGELCISCRVALISYVLARLEIFGPRRGMGPPYQLLELKNVDEVAAAAERCDATLAL